MDHAKAALLSSLLAAAALAGCTDGELGIDVTPAVDPKTQPYRFSATGPGETFEWDFGDGSPKQAGQEVEHTFGFTDGTLTVRLTARDAEAVHTASTTVKLGTGVNRAPALAMTASTNWAKVGEPVRFSGADSTDPDGDPLLFSWSCFRKGDLKPIDKAHTHPDLGGTPFQSGSTSFSGTVATAPIGQPGKSSADFCADFGGTFQYERTAIVEGTFTNPGVYTVTMLARDPKTPAAAGEFTLVVSPTKPSPVVEHTFTGQLQGGAGGAAQDVAAQLGQEGTYDRVAHSWTLVLPNTMTWVNLTAASGTSVPFELVYNLARDGTNQLTDQAGNAVLENAPAGIYSAVLRLESGVMVDYTLTVYSIQKMDPFKLYEPL